MNILKRIWCWVTLNHIDPGVKEVRDGYACKKCSAMIDVDPFGPSEKFK